MSGGAVDLAAERARSRERRAPGEIAEARLARAKMILAGRWNATADELREVLVERYPKNAPATTEELLEIVLEVQRTERPRMPVHPQKGDAHVPTTTSTPMTIADKPRVLEFLAQKLKDNPELKPRQLIPLVKEELGISVQTSRIYDMVKAAKKENHKRGARAAEAEPEALTPTIGSAPPASPDRQETATPPDNTQLEERRAAPVDQVASCEVELVETRESSEYSRVQLQDGKWILQAQIPFGDRAAAYRALAALAGAA